MALRVIAKLTRSKLGKIGNGHAIHTLIRISRSARHKRSKRLSTTTHASRNVSVRFRIRVKTAINSINNRAKRVSARCHLPNALVSSLTMSSVPPHSANNAQNTVGETDANNTQQSKLPIESLAKLPNPRIDYLKYNIGNNYNKPSYICDANSLLSDSERESIDTLVNNLHLKCNYQIGIAVISSFEDYKDYINKSTKNEFYFNQVRGLSKKYCIMAHSRWDKNNIELFNGIMMFISVNDKYLFLTRGIGIAHVISQDFGDKYLLPKYFKNSDKKFATCLNESVSELCVILENYYNGTFDTSDECYDAREFNKQNNNYLTNFRPDTSWTQIFVSLSVGMVVVGSIVFYNSPKAVKKQIKAAIFGAYRTKHDTSVIQEINHSPNQSKEEK